VFSLFLTAAFYLIRSQRLPSLCIPGIHHGRGNLLKVLDVPRGQSGMRGKNNSGDHGIAEFPGPPPTLSLSGQFRRTPCRGLVEVDDSLLHNLVEPTLKRVHERNLPLPGRRRLQTEANLENRHGSRPDRGLRLLVKPTQDALIRSGKHDLRNYVCIHEYHLSNQIGCKGKLRHSRLRRYHDSDGAAREPDSAVHFRD